MCNTEKLGMRLHVHANCMVLHYMDLCSTFVALYDFLNAKYTILTKLLNY